MTEFIPWWLTSVGLAITTLLYWKLVNRPLGVSGSWARVVQWRQEGKILKAEQPFVNKPELLLDALMVATVEEFGKIAVQNAISQAQNNVAVASTTNSRDDSNSLTSENIVTMSTRIPRTAHLLFLVSLIVGGMISTIILNGHITLSSDLGELHQSIFGTGFSYNMALFFGGLLVGFGTQMGGGCTSGHGLSGVSRLIPASLIATGAFFGAAVVISLLMKGA